MSGLWRILFCKKEREPQSAAIREKCGVLASITGILINLFLFCIKWIAGVLSMSVAIKADAVNNLSDAGSCIIFLVSFQMSGKPPDRHHPFGHARMEYIASMAVSFSILLMGVELFKTSFHKILNPSSTTFGILPALILLISIFTKLWLFFFYKRVGKRIRSSVLEAASADSMSDLLSTAAVFLSMLASHFAGIPADGYMGLAVAIVIFLSAVKILNQTKNHILGAPPDPKMIKEIETIVGSCHEIIGIHDLVIHQYGPGKYFATLHAEYDGSKDIFQSHDIIDRVESEIKSKLGIDCVVHMDPVVPDNEDRASAVQTLNLILREINQNLSVHDFRYVAGGNQKKLIFDLAIPFECPIDPESLQKTIESKLKEADERYHAVITFDRK